MGESNFGKLTWGYRILEVARLTLRKLGATCLGTLYIEAVNLGKVDRTWGIGATNLGKRGAANLGQLYTVKKLGAGAVNLGNLGATNGG